MALVQLGAARSVHPVVAAGPVKLAHGSMEHALNERCIVARQHLVAVRRAAPGVRKRLLLALHYVTDERLQLEELFLHDLHVDYWYDARVGRGSSLRRLGLSRDASVSRAVCEQLMNSRHAAIVQVRR